MGRAGKVYFHVDVNSAFLSWSALKQLAAGETVDLRTIPAVVGGDEEKRHGVVLAKSMAAKRYGIQTGESLFAARAKCPGLTVTAPDFDWYVKNSKALIAILQDYSPEVEQYSIDEAFVDMTGSERLFGPPQQAADAIRERVKRELGFTVNVGVAPNRLLAKMASDFEKPDKTHTLSMAELPQKMWPLPVGELFGVGPSAAAKLNRFGIMTIGQLAACRQSDVVRWFGVRGDTLWNYANGRESDPMTKQTRQDSSYGNSVTTAKDLQTPTEADATLLALCDSVGSRLRRDGKTARVVAVTLVDNAFRRRSHQVTLQNPTNATDVIYRTATELMQQMWPPRPVRLVGVSAEKTGQDNFEQLDFFTDPVKSEKKEKLERTADVLRKRFGDAALTRAKLLGPDAKTPGALSAAKERDKRKG